MPKKSLTIEQILTLLTEMPQRIAELTVPLSPVQLQMRPTLDEWSLNEVLAHLRSCGDVWGGCIATILAEDKPTLRAINPTTWIKQTNYCELEFQPSLQSFLAQRADLLATLSSLSSEDWERSATVTGAGAVLQLTVFSYAHRLAIHERSHVNHIARAVKNLHM